jgi:hypothetical protein
MYVADEHTERDFYELFWLQRTTKGMIPGLPAIRHGDPIFGLPRTSSENLRTREAYGGSSSSPSLASSVKSSPSVRSTISPMKS